MGDLDETFENTTAFAWLSKNAHKYGFVLRYPADKVDTTGYKYEPWHYRFVGREAATEMYLADVCFEEYLSQAKAEQ
jgi:D-alanyl-D-alanine carboxypeptidase